MKLLPAIKLIFQRDRATEIAKELFPQITLEPKGSLRDQYGIDGDLNGNTIQLKFDGGIPLRKNIYHEIYEKSANRPEQAWRKSPCNATHYIFTTETSQEIIGILIPVDTLAELEAGKELKMIRPNRGSWTSMGFFLSYEELQDNCKFRKLIKKAKES